MKLNNILELLSAVPKEIMDTAEAELKALKYTITRDPEDLFLFAVPPATQTAQTVPMLVAHVDVVGEIVPEREDLILNKSKNKITLDPESKARVLGADDRAGVYAVFAIVKSLSLRSNDSALPFVALTDLEEVGGIGAGAVVASDLLHDHIKQISCYIELDRKGNGGFVSYDACGSPNNGLKEMFEDQGFRLGHGSYSDVADFTAQTGVSNVNLSVGYYNEHTEKETLFMDELGLTISRVLRMWDDCPSLFTAVFEQEEYEGFDLDADWNRGYPQYEAMLDMVYMMVESAEESEDVFGLVSEFVMGLSPKILTELVVHLEDVVDDLCYNDTEAAVAEALVNVLTSRKGEEEEEEEEEEESKSLDTDFGLYVDARGAVVCGAKNRVGCY